MLTGINSNVIYLGVVSFFNDAASEMIYPLLPLFISTVLGAGPAAIGIIEGVAESTAAIVKLASGFISDKIKQRKYWVTSGYFLSNAARPLIGVATAWTSVLALRFIDRIGKGVRTSARDALIADSTAAQFRGKAFGFHRAADHAGAVAGPLLATLLLMLFQLDLKTVFVLSVIPGMLTVAIVLFAVKDNTVKSEPEVEQPLNIRMAWNGMPNSLRRFVFLLFIFTLGNSTDAFLLLKAQRLGVPIALIPLLWEALHVVKMVSSIPGGIASDRLGRKGVIAAGWTVYAITYAGFAVADSAWHVWTLFAFYGLYFGLCEGAEKAMIADLAPEHLRGSAFGLYHLMIAAGALPASLLFGWIWQVYGDVYAFGLGALLALAATLLLLPLSLKR
ncbi:MAG: MFS transporter [Ignavibacteria bacterium]|nr:MAG: MFS transporter [Ignavibacteria bacterium]